MGKAELEGERGLIFFSGGRGWEGLSWGGGSEIERVNFFREIGTCSAADTPWRAKLMVHWLPKNPALVPGYTGWWSVQLNSRTEQGRRAG